jgi:hypothetical protein
MAPTIQPKQKDIYSFAHEPWNRLQIQVLLDADRLNAYNLTALSVHIAGGRCEFGVCFHRKLRQSLTQSPIGGNSAADAKSPSIVREGVLAIRLSTTALESWPPPAICCSLR